MHDNPYQAPQSNLAVRGSAEAPPLWNPNAAVRWSLLFSPVFGALLHSRNWEALGEPEKAETAWRWAMATIAYFVITIASGFVLSPAQEMAFDRVARFGGIALLLGWYATSGRKQAHLIQARYGKNYPRRGWGKPFLYTLLAIGLLVLVGFGEAMYADLHHDYPG